MIGKHRLLIVDDEKYICDVILEMFRESSVYQLVAESDPGQALELLRKHSFDLLLADLYMGSHSGMQMMEQALQKNPEAIVILMTGYPTIENAIAALKQGAYDYLIKPFSLDQLKLTVDRGLRKQQLARENVQLKEQLALYQIAEAMGSAVHLDEALNQVLKLAIKEFDAESVSILFSDPVNCEVLTLQAKQVKSDRHADHRFLEGETGHSLAAVQTREVQVDDQSVQAMIGQESFENARFSSLVVCPLMVRGRVIGLLNLERVSYHRPFAKGELQSLKIIASKAAYAISNSKLYDDLEKAYLSTIAAFAHAVEARDRYTRGHTVRVTYLSELIARELGWSEDQLMTLYMGASLHDVGKIGVPDSVLNKEGPLDEEEKILMQRHPVVGARMIEGIPFLAQCLPYIVSHHERWDGKGYPYGLKGEEIPLEGRILAVADTVDAIMSDRPYRERATIEVVLGELRSHAGKQFDPMLVETFIDVLGKNREKIEVLYGIDLRQAEVKKELV